MIKFNINGTVFVRLNLEGVAYLQAYEEPIVNIVGYSAWQPDENGYYHWPLWQFMQIFGPSIDQGYPAIFETELLLKDMER